MFCGECSFCFVFLCVPLNLRVLTAVVLRCVHQGVTQTGGSVTVLLGYWGPVLSSVSQQTSTTDRSALR